MTGIPVLAMSIKLQLLLCGCKGKLAGWVISSEKLTSEMGKMLGDSRQCVNQQFLLLILTPGISLQKRQKGKYNFQQLFVPTKVKTRSTLIYVNKS